MPHGPKVFDRSRVDPSQADVVAFLESIQLNGGQSVTRIDTHISHVFIAGAKTYKLKRAVKMNFVDFSTIEKRRLLCEREVEVNRANAPEIYLGVKAIVRTDSGLSLGGEGTPVDYVVEMATFDPEKAFDRLAARNEITSDQIRVLASIIARQHCSAIPSPEFGGSDVVLAIIEQVAAAIASAGAGAKLTNEIADWKSAAMEAAHAASWQLNARKRHGYVRRCHGDLHLGNICLFKGRPTLFDAIEFSAEIATVDVLYDCAFTTMDLLQMGLRDHANHLISRYLNITRDYSGMSILGLFVSLRAAVRAMVSASLQDVEEGERNARRKLNFALDALSANKPPQLILIGGLSGSGKSTLAQQIAPAFDGLIGAVTIRSDVCRKRLYSVAPEDPLPLSAYSKEASDAVYSILQKDAGRALKAGTSVIIDATFIEGEKTSKFEDIAISAGASFNGLWLHLDLEALKQRVATRRGDASDATPAVVEEQWKRAYSASSWQILDAAGAPDEVAASAKKALGLA